MLLQIKRDGTLPTDPTEYFNFVVDRYWRANTPVLTTQLSEMYNKKLENDLESRIATNRQLAIHIGSEKTRQNGWFQHWSQLECKSATTTQCKRKCWLLSGQRDEKTSCDCCRCTSSKPRISSSYTDLQLCSTFAKLYSVAVCAAHPPSYASPREALL